jgi:hypothetical protein
MDSSFEIHTPVSSKLGDFVGFTVHDGSRSIPAHISRTALAVLCGNGRADLAAFEASKERIREVAYERLRRNPTDYLLNLTSSDFK